MRILLLVILTSGFLPACSGGTGFGGGRSADTETDGEEEPADIPAEVSGSFLTMGCGLLGEMDNSAPIQQVGCVAYDQEHDRYSVDHKFKLTLQDGGKTIPITTRKASDPQWDIEGDVPTLYMRSTSASFHMTVETESDLVASESFPVSEVLGNSLHGAVSGDTMLTGFETHTWWKFEALAGQMADAYDGPQAGDFCGSNGAIKNKVKDDSNPYEDEDIDLTEMLGTKAYPIEKRKTFTPETSECFMKFEFNGDDADKYVYPIPATGPAKCYAIAISGALGELEYLIIDVKESSVADSLSVESLEAFITANTRCG